MVYRRRVNSDVWHFMRTCRWWPWGLHLKGFAVARDRKPTTGELCNECLAKQMKSVSFSAKAKR